MKWGFLDKMTEWAGFTPSQLRRTPPTQSAEGEFLDLYNVNSLLFLQKNKLTAKLPITKETLIWNLRRFFEISRGSVARLKNKL